MDSELTVINAKITDLIPNKYQPRKFFDEAALDELGNSIKNYGIINPIIVRKNNEKYEIISGERRYRAAKKIGLSEVPVIVKTATEQQMAELALIENLQRQDLNAIETAKSYEEILKLGNQTQQSLSAKIGKSQSSIANKIRLLSLPEEIQEAIKSYKISERHARALLSVKEKQKQIELLNKIINEKLTVKETEKIINQKEITSEEIENALSDIMNSLNKKEEKEDDNMNNGNFFPNYDNNMNPQNNQSLNMMNQEALMNFQITSEPENVMPTIQVPEFNQQNMTAPSQMEPVINTTENQEMSVPPMMEPTPIPTLGVPPMLEPSMNPQVELIQPNVVPETPLFNYEQESAISQTQTPEFNQQNMMAPPQIEPVINTLENQEMNFQPIMPQQSEINVPQFNETPLFTNPMEQSKEPQQINESFYEIPLNISPVIETNPQEQNKHLEVEKLLSDNGIAYKSYSNDQGYCIIIEI